MDSERKRGGGIAAAPKNGVISGSVWETRMKNDDVKGGVKVFNGEQNSQENVTNNNNEIQVCKRVKPKQSVAPVPAAAAAAGKRKTWKSDNSDGIEKSPVQISKQRPEKEKNLEGKCRELSVSAAEGMKKSPPAHIKKPARSDAAKELSSSGDGFDGSPIYRMRTRAMWQRLSGDAGDLNSISLRKLKSAQGVDDSEKSPGLRKAKSERNGRNSVELGRKDVDFEDNGIKKSQSSTSLDDFDVIEEKEITTDLDNNGQTKSPRFMESDDEDEDEEDDWDDDDEMEDAVEKKSIVVKQMNVLAEQQKSISPINGKQIPAPAAATVVVAEKKIVQRNERTPPVSSIGRKQVPPVVNHQPRFISKPTDTNSNYSAEELDEPQKVTRTHSKLQSLVDLVMWRDVSRSTLIFGVGTFSIISSSYTKDLNISFISVISYLGLVYLAAIFIFRSIIKRGAVVKDDTNQGHVVGEEEAIWVLKMILPYINEFLLNVRALFSGDPATTMKLAVLLFVLARCGSSITIWKMAKLGFFGVFTVPKVCSSYSTQLTALGTFWIRRFTDAWESCTHKKAVGFGIFTIVWNLSSVVARIWAVFMLFVAFKYYQQSMIKEEWTEEDVAATATTTGGGGEDSWQGQRQGRNGPTFMVNSQKLKKKI